MNDFLSFADRVEEARGMLRRGIPHARIINKHGHVVLNQAIFLIQVSRREHPPEGRDDYARERLDQFRQRVAAIVRRRREAEAA